MDLDPVPLALGGGDLFERRRLPEQECLSRFDLEAPPILRPELINFLSMLPSPNMSQERGDHSWYREEARRFRERAALTKNDDHWRNSYLRLARAYERIAEVLEADRRAQPRDR